MQAVLDAFEPLGVTGEGIGQYGIIAPDVDLRAVMDLLVAGVADGRWDDEEGCVTDAWLAL